MQTFFHRSYIKREYWIIAVQAIDSHISKSRFQMVIIIYEPRYFFNVGWQIRPLFVSRKLGRTLLRVKRQEPWRIPYPQSGRQDILRQINKELIAKSFR